MNPSEAVAVGRMTSTPILIHEDFDPKGRTSQSRPIVAITFLIPTIGGIYRIGRKHGSAS